ncbi:MAG: uroporphyrinogen-III synthase [Rhizomicrobium sp.]
MRVLVTRPRGDAQETAAILRARGHEAVIAPLLDIRDRAGAEIALDGVQAILVTSANGIRALAKRALRRDVKVLAVGAQSNRAARDAGFTDVEHAAGDAAALAALAAAQLAPGDGVLLHAAGAETRGALAATLAAKGFTLRTEVLYEAVPVEALPVRAADALAENRLDAVLLYSPRTARIFATLLARAGLRDSCRAVTALCISQATADALAPVAFRAVRVASHPDQDALLALLD